MIRATCIDEACVLRATGLIRVKFLKRNGKVRKTKSIKLKKATASAPAGKAVKLKLKLQLGRRAKKLVRKSYRRKAAKAIVTVRATDSAGNASSGRRKVKIIRR